VCSCRHSKLSAWIRSRCCVRDRSGTVMKNDKAVLKLSALKRLVIKRYDCHQTHLYSYNHTVEIAVLAEGLFFDYDMVNKFL
jgi:hypothetical protein